MVDTRIETIPEKALIFVNNVYKGTTDRFIVIQDSRAGDVVRAERFGYKTQSTTLDQAGLGGTFVFTLSKEPVTQTENVVFKDIGINRFPDQIQLVVESNPDGAIFQTLNIVLPRVIQDSAAVTHIITFPGKEDISFTTTEEQIGRIIRVTINFEAPEEPDPITTFESTPSKAAIFVRELFLGLTPVSSRLPKEGDLVKFELEGYRTVEFNLGADEIGKTVSIILIEEEPPPPEEETLWDRIKGFLGDTITKINDFLQNPPIGEFFAIWSNLINSTLDKLGVSQDSIIRYETDLDPQEAFKWLIFAPLMGTAEAGIAIKGLFPTATSAEIKTLTARFGSKATAEALETWMLANPLKAITQWKLLPFSIRNKVGGRLLETPAGREVYFGLDAKAFTPKTATTNAFKILGMTVALASLATTIIGSYPFTGFLKEEALQTLGFAVRTAKENRDLEGFRKALDEQKALLDPNVTSKILSLIPFANILAAVKDFFDAARIKLAIDEEAFEDLKKELEEEPPIIEEAITILSIERFPSVTQIGTPITLTAKITSASEAPTTINTTFEILKDGNVISFGGEDNLTVSKFSPLETSFIVITDAFSIGFHDVDVSVTESATNKVLATKNFFDVFQLTEPEEEELPPEEQVATLIIKGKPDDAKIEVAAHPEITTQGTFKVPIGSYQVRASKEGFTSFQSTFFLDVGDIKTFAFNLQEIDVEEPKGAITISTNPQGAKVSVDGVFEFDVTPLTVFQKAGDHLVRMTLEGFKPKEETLTWEDGVNSEINFVLDEEEPPPVLPPTRVLITSDPSFADVFIDGEFQFTTTPFTAFLDAGKHTIRVQLEGYVPSESEITLKAGESITLKFPLNKEAPAPPGEIIITPPDQIPPPDFRLLNPPAIEVPFEPEFPSVTEKELLINIETTDVLPWKGRIFSIAMLDLNDPLAIPLILIENNEAALIEQFLDLFEKGNFAKLVGFKLTFDYRFIFAKMLLYRLRSKKFVDIDLRDVKQILDQVKEKFVYFPDRRGTLSDWGKHLLGRGKFGKQETILREFIAGNFDYVRDFQTRQIELTRDLYALARFVSSGGLGATETSVPGEGSSHLKGQSSHLPITKEGKQCKNCLQVNPFDRTECLVCGDKL